MSMVANIKKKCHFGSKAADLSCNINLNCILLCASENPYYLRQIDRLAIHAGLAAFSGFH